MKENKIHVRFKSQYFNFKLPNTLLIITSFHKILIKFIIKLLLIYIKY